MGIYIKGVEMPTACFKCELFEADTDWCRGAKREVENPYSDDGVCTFCPLVPVPPHGRLIDADALLADVRKRSESYFADDFAHEWVDKQPTIIEAEGEE